MYLNANYHTHTYRCNHATGTEREYIENAIKAGIKKLGFSDHSIYLFDGDNYSGFRMKPDEIKDYVEDLNKLRHEYKNDIEIYIGFEMEYYPKLFERTVKYIAECGIEYLILGQHFLGNEFDMNHHCINATTDESLLSMYADQVTEGISTGKFTYIAHPDMFNYVGDDAVYRKHMSRICETAKELDIPLEFNFLGFSTHRNYPCEKFFRIAKEFDNDIVFGCDAHSAANIYRKDTYDSACEYLERLGLKHTEDIKLLSIK